jgi:hypothetical protein
LAFFRYAYESNACGRGLSALLAGPCIAAGPLSVTISQSSIRINGVELRSGPRGDNGRYISLAAAEKVLERPQDA